MRRRAVRNCKVAIFLFIAAAGIIHLISLGHGNGGRGGSAAYRQIRKPKRLIKSLRNFNGTLFRPDKELDELSGLRTASGVGDGDGGDPIGSLTGERSNGMGSFNDSVFSDGVLKDPPSVLRTMRDMNEAQLLRNEELFGPVTNDTVVIAVQVHNRLQYLRQLIVSLSQARDIERTLIVFSHDFWDPEINRLVASVDFAMTTQIFYPYSIQTHPGDFPGESKSDCPRNMKKRQ